MPNLDRAKQYVAILAGAGIERGLIGPGEVGPAVGSHMC